MNHRIFYLEDQVTSLQNSFIQVNLILKICQSLFGCRGGKTSSLRLLFYDIFCLCGCTGERLPVQDSQLQSFGNPGQDRGPCGPTNGPLRQADPIKTGFPKILVLRNNFHLQKLLMNWKLIFFILKRIFISF